MAEFSFHNLKAVAVNVAIEPWAMTCETPPASIVTVVYEQEGDLQADLTLHDDGSVTLGIYATKLPDIRLDGEPIS